MYKRIVVKVGTKVLTKENGKIDGLVLENIVEQIASLRQKGIEVVLVTSGAVGSGRGLVKTVAGTETVADKQVFAAVGQVKLMETYARLFKKHNHLCAQVLVTKEDFRDRGHYHNMKRCFLNMLRDGIVPVVNENDVIAIKELVFTDNDELAGLIASQLEADAVMLLTSVDGVLDGDPSALSAKTIPTIDWKHLTEFQKHVTKEKTAVGRGGMLTKFGVAKKLIASGIAVHVIHGKKKNVLRDVIEGKQTGTFFVPLRKASGVKRRLAYSDGLTMGAIRVNKCAGEMLVSKEHAMSLLPVGVTKVSGEFKKGDVIEIQNERGGKIGFGVSALDSEKVKETIGKKGAKEVVHYDYLFIE